MARDGGLGVTLERCSVVLGGRRVVDRATLMLAPGDKCLLVGANGAGKTQLVKLLAGLTWPTPARGSRRRWVDAAGHELDALDAKPRIAYVGAESQDRYRRFGWNHTLAEVVTTGLYGTDIPLDRPGPRARATVRALLEQLDLTRVADRPMLEASYGERRLALLGRALVAEPALLALDEAYNGLDAAHRAVLDRVLAGLMRRPVTLVLTAHRAADAPAGISRWFELDAGRCREVAQPATARYVGAGHARPGTAAARARAAARPGSRARAALPVFELRRVTVYRDEVAALRQLDWRVQAGEHWAVTGPNGSGKSTLLGVLYGSHPVAAGGELRRAAHAPGTPLEELRRGMALLSPELQADYRRADTLLEVVVGGLRGSVGLDSRVTRSERRRARAVLAALGLDRLAGRRAGEVSYGELRLALVARALVRAPQLLLLDEALTGLDAARRAAVLAELEQRARAGATLVMALHHRDDRPAVLNRELRLRRGRAPAGAQPRRRGVTSRR